MKGKIKEKTGQVTRNSDLEDEGRDEQLGGKVQTKVGHVENVLGR